MSQQVGHISLTLLLLYASYVHHVQRSDGSHKLAQATDLSQGRGDGSKIRKKNTCTHKQAHEPRCLGAESRLERWAMAKCVASESSSFTLRERCER